MARAGGGVIVTGDKEVDRLLRRLPFKVQTQLSRKASRIAAKDIVLAEARRRVPVDEGELEASLTVKAMKRSRSRFGHQVTTKPGAFESGEFYGAFPEYGTKERVHKSGKSVGRVEPHSFGYMRVSLYDNAVRIHALYVRTMRELINGLRAN